MQTIRYGDPEFLADFPEMEMWALGDVAGIPPKDRRVGIVGSRASTMYGNHVAADFAAAFAKAGWCVVSGGAYGIDIAAHRGAVAVDGSTLVVLASGVDVHYPVAHSQFFSEVRMRERCAVISGYPPGTTPSKYRFLERNGHLVSLVSALVVVEAGERSGSTSAVNVARATGVPVYAVPGPITSAVSAATNRLIRDGEATLITDPTEILP